jgi:MoaA/NifB/PqqE/SkfB family radical SAM enzyme
MKKITSRWAHQNSIKIEWNIGKFCNYDCSYCPSSIHDAQAPFLDVEAMMRTVDQLISIGKPIRISFTGGEPTAHPRFEDLVNYCKHVGVSWISVTTNGTRNPSWYLKQRVDQWVFSIHFEYNWAKTLHAIKTVKENSIVSMLIHVMALHDKMPQVKECANILMIHSIPHVIRRIRWTEGDHDLFDDMRYAPDDLIWIKEYNATVSPNCIIDDEQHIHANDVIKLHLNQYKGWSCNAGIESLMINWDGEVYRATCRVGGSLGNIYTGTAIVPIDPITCTRDWCTCAADIPLTKSTND